MQLCPPRVGERRCVGPLGPHGVGQQARRLRGTLGIWHSWRVATAPPFLPPVTSTSRNRRTKENYHKLSRDIEARSHEILNSGVGHRTANERHNQGIWTNGEPKLTGRAYWQDRISASGHIDNKSRENWRLGHMCKQFGVLGQKASIFGKLGHMGKPALIDHLGAKDH